LAELYSNDYHAELRAPGATEAAFGPKFRRYADWIQSFCRSGRVLDIGCSTGLLVRMLCDRGFDAEGIELNAASANWAARHYGVKVQTDPLQEGLFESGRFDLMIMADVLEHTVTPLNYLKMVRKFLSPGGFMLISFPDIRSLESRYWLMTSRLARRRWLWTNCHIPHHIWEFTRSTAERMFLEAGFQVAGFRRHQPRPERHSSIPMRLLSLPTHVLRLPGISGACGTQMEFLIRRND